MQYPNGRKVSWCGRAIRPRRTYTTEQFGTGPRKDHTMIILKFINENENNAAKIMIPFNIVNHIAMAISVKVITIRYFPLPYITSMAEM